MSQFIADNLETVEALDGRDVHLWVGRVGTGDVQDVAVPAEIEARAASRVDASDGARLRAMHRRIRWVLGNWLDCGPDELCLSRTAQGQPVLESGQSVSWAHSEDAIAIAMHKAGPVGVDLQMHCKRDWMAMLTMVAMLEERIQIGSSEAAFYRLWCLKEAVAKADGRGLGQTLKLIRLGKDLIAGEKKFGRAGLEDRAFACCVRSVDLSGDVATLAIALEIAEID